MNTTARRYYVYIMASLSGTLYVGVTNSVYSRAMQHKDGETLGFTARYKVDRLVYFEVFKYVKNAIALSRMTSAGSMNPLNSAVDRDASLRSA